MTNGNEVAARFVEAFEALGVDYIHRWTDEHGSRALLDEIRASIPPIE